MKKYQKRSELQEKTALGYKTLIDEFDMENVNNALSKVPGLEFALHLGSKTPRPIKGGGHSMLKIEDINESVAQITEGMDGLFEVKKKFLNESRASVDDIEAELISGTKDRYSLSYKIPGRTSDLGKDYIQMNNSGRGFKENEIDRAKKKMADQINKAYSRPSPDKGDVVNTPHGPATVTKVYPNGHVDYQSIENDDEYDDGRPRSIAKDVSPVYFSMK